MTYFIISIYIIKTNLKLNFLLWLIRVSWFPTVNCLSPWFWMHSLIQYFWWRHEEYRFFLLFNLSNAVEARINHFCRSVLLPMSVMYLIWGKNGPEMTCIIEWMVYSHDFGRVCSNYLYVIQLSLVLFRRPQNTFLQWKKRCTEINFFLLRYLANNRCPP